MRVDLEKLPVASGLVSLSGKFLWGSDALKSEIGLAADDPLNFSFQDITFAEDLEEDLRNVDALLSGSAARYAMEKRYVFDDQDPFWIDLNVALHRGKDGSAEHFVVCIKNIQDRKTLEAEMKKLAYEDALTGLANRTAFLNYAERLAHGMSGARIAVGVVDLDGLKWINDTFGHLVGDSAICAVATRLQAIVGDAGLVARLGGDEFGVILTRPSKGAAYLNGQGQMKTSLTRPGHRFAISASVGFSDFVEPTVDISLLLSQADKRMYEAKSRRQAGLHSVPVGRQSRA